jgi:hypothetical protein
MPQEQSDRRQYAKTLEALEGYVKKNLKFADDIAPFCDNDEGAHNYATYRPW